MEINLEDFFKYNLEIKDEMLKLSPMESDNYNEEARIKCGDKLYFGLLDLEDLFTKLCKSINRGEINQFIQSLFKNYQSKLLQAGYDYNRLKQFYRENISNMSDELINTVKSNFVGYTLDMNIFNGLNKVKTINELLHVFHAYVVNNENIYNSVNVVSQKDINGQIITLRGNQSPLATSIYNAFNNNIRSNYVDLISLDKGNKIIIMLRDLGHALTVEIDKDQDNYYVKYFIPKVCNYLMVNELKGINKVKKGERIAKGEFVSTNETIITDLFTFIEGVPTDEEMFIPGGLCYNEERQLH